MTHKYDELLIEGLSKLKELEFSHIPEADEIHYAFSEDYIKSKEKLLNKLGRSYWKYVNTVAKKVAVIIITFIIAFSSLMTVDAFRDKIIDFVYKIYSTFTEINRGEITNNNDNITTFYSIHNLPVNYKQIIANYSDVFSYVMWSNSTENDITISQVPLNTSHIFNSEYGKLNEATINNTPCLVCRSNTNYFCYWEFDGYRFELIYPIDLGEEFMSEVVGKLVEIDPEELNN